MASNYRFSATALFIIGAFSACSSSDDDSPGDAGSTSSGGTAGNGGAPTSGGGHSGSGIGNHGGTANAGEAGSINSGAGTGGAGGESGNNAGAGDGGEVLGQLEDILGPTTVDQMPILIDRSHIIDSDPLVTISRVFSDSNGNIVVFGSNLASGAFVAKYGPDGSQKWINSSLTPPPASMAPGAPGSSIADATLGANDEIFFGGSTQVALPGESQNGAMDAVVGKLDANGNAVWMHQWGSSSLQGTRAVAAGPGGSVFATGSCDGQVPGNPSTNTGGPFAVRYEADGARTWLKQYSKQSAAGPGAVFLSGRPLVDATGNLYLLGGGGLRKIDTNGDWLLDAASTDYVAAYAGRNYVFGLGGRSFYAFNPHTTDLFQISLDGKVLWYRSGRAQSAVIDAVENVIWNGSFDNSHNIGDTLGGGLSVTEDSIYISGYYDNNYQNGSTPHPMTVTGYVGRYDLAGQQVWFQEFVLDQTPLTTPPVASSSYIGLVADPDGNVIVVTEGNGPVETSPGTYTAQQSSYIFKLSKSDGSLL